jgi:hypothetical protein
VVVDVVLIEGQWDLRLWAMRKVKLGKEKWPGDDRDVLVSTLSLALSSTSMTRLVGWDIATLEARVR